MFSTTGSSIRSVYSNMHINSHSVCEMTAVCVPNGFCDLIVMSHLRFELMLSRSELIFDLVNFNCWFFSLLYLSH